MKILWHVVMCDEGQTDKENRKKRKAFNFRFLVTIKARVMFERLRERKNKHDESQNTNNEVLIKNIFKRTNIRSNENQKWSD